MHQRQFELSQIRHLASKSAATCFMRTVSLGVKLNKQTAQCASKLCLNLLCKGWAIKQLGIIHRKQLSGWPGKITVKLIYPWICARSTHEVNFWNIQPSKSHQWSTDIRPKRWNIHVCANLQGSSTFVFEQPKDERCIFLEGILYICKYSCRNF
jgi:hypothetical protein